MISLLRRIVPLALSALTLGVPPAQAQRAATEPQAATREVGPASWLSGSSRATEGFDATYYELHLDIDFDAERITGTTHIQGRVAAGPIATLDLDLARTMTVSGVRDEAGEELAFTHDEDVLSIELGREAADDEYIDVYVAYAGAPASTGFGSFTFDRHTAGSVAWTLSEPYGAREWWPGKDHPSDKADSVRLVVTVPEDLDVASNGVLVSKTTGNARATFEWVHRYPIAPYLVSIAAGPYLLFEQQYVRPDSLAASLGPLALPVVHYVYDTPEARLYPGWAEVVDMLAVYEHWFGPYPFPEEKYGHAEFTWSGGMEHQTMSSMGGSSILLVAHEVAHQWYGNLITLHTWPHLWLNEGFASYAELLYWEAMRHRYPGRFESELAVDMQLARNAPGTLVVQDTLNISNLFNSSRVYAKGSVVLHMLRRMIGDDAFRSVLQEYAADESVRYGTAVTSDFKRIAERVSGRDLTAFIRQWVTDGFGHPVYEVAWTHGDDPREIVVTVSQIQSMPLSNITAFEMPLTLLIQTESGEERHVVFNDRRVQAYRIRLQSRALELTFDPDLDLLRNSEVQVLDADEMPYVRTGFRSVFPNPASQRATIQFALGRPASPQLALFDALGREVRRLALPTHRTGIHEHEMDIAGLASGTYLLRMEVAGDTYTRSLVVARD